MENFHCSIEKFLISVTPSPWLSWRLWICSLRHFILPITSMSSVFPTCCRLTVLEITFLLLLRWFKWYWLHIDSYSCVELPWQCALVVTLHLHLLISWSRGISSAAWAQETYKVYIFAMGSGSYYPSYIQVFSYELWFMFVIEVVDTNMDASARFYEIDLLFITAIQAYLLWRITLWTSTGRWNMSHEYINKKCNHFSS